MSSRATVNSSPLEIAQQHVITELILERDEAREKYNNLATENMLAVNKLCNERDEAREDQKNSRQSLAVAIEELDEAREALMKIEQLFIDGTDVYADREKMATIAIEALEVAK
jgi:protein subunit release factor B